MAIAIPFYLARPELTAMHAEHTGHVEGLSPADILRYLRHEMGHVVNYAYRLYDDGAWVERFGAITQPYVEHYRPEPFSRRFVRHLPGWYAQKHPDGPHLHHIEHQIRRPPGQARDQLLEVAIYMLRTVTSWPRSRSAPATCVTAMSTSLSPSDSA